MLNPNDKYCTLYPEEIATLLRTGRIARFEKTNITEGNEPLIGPPTPAPAWLMETLTLTLAALPFVQAAYLASLHTPDGGEAGSMLLASP